MEWNDAPNTNNEIRRNCQHIFEPETLLGSKTTDLVCKKCGVNKSKQTGEIFY